MSVDVRVLYFAAARELSGTAEESLALPAATLDGRAFLALVGAKHPALAPFLERMRLAVNGEIGAVDVTVRPGDEVAILPPVAGGAPDADPIALCELRDTPLSVDELLATLKRPDAGAVALFLGAVRDHAEGKAVARLDYEAHPELALRELRAVLTEVAGRFPTARLAVVHRVGRLEIGDLAVIVGASTPHRSEAFAACREAIELLKQRVPIWKKEWAPDGTANWVNLSG